jgi:transposase
MKHKSLEQKIYTTIIAWIVLVGLNVEIISANQNEAIAVSNHCTTTKAKSSSDTFNDNVQKTVNKKCKTPKKNALEHTSNDSSSQSDCNGAAIVGGGIGGVIGLFFGPLGDLEGASAGAGLFSTFCNNNNK